MIRGRDFSITQHSDFNTGTNDIAIRVETGKELLGLNISRYEDVDFDRFVFALRKLQGVRNERQPIRNQEDV